MMKSDTLALIVARPGRLRESLSVLLAATSQIGRVDNVDDGPAALRMFAESPPALVLLDTNMPNDGVQTVLRQIKAGWPQTLCLVLADNDQERRAAQAAGADGVLLKGFSAARLLATVERLLKPPVCIKV